MKIDAKKLKIGDKITRKDVWVKGECVVIKHIQKGQSVPEYKQDWKASEDVILCINNVGKFHLPFAYNTFMLLDSVENNRTLEEINNPKNLKPGDVFSDKYRSGTFIKITDLYPGDCTNQYGITEVKEPCSIVYSYNRNYLPITNENRKYPLYRLKNNLFARTTNIVESTTQDLSMWNTTCICGKPAYQGAGPVECSDKNCNINTTY